MIHSYFSKKRWLSILLAVCVVLLTSQPVLADQLTLYRSTVFQPNPPSPGQQPLWTTDNFTICEPDTSLSLTFDYHGIFELSNPENREYKLTWELLRDDSRVAIQNDSINIDILTWPYPVYYSFEKVPLIPGIYQLHVKVEMKHLFFNWLLGWKEVFDGFSNNIRVNFISNKIILDNPITQLVYEVKACNSIELLPGFEYDASTNNHIFQAHIWN